MDKIRGAGVAIVTPFKNDNLVDYDGLEKLINHVINGGINYLVVLGTTGESTTLEDSEKVKVLDFCKKVNNGRLPIVIGIGGNNTKKVIADLKIFNLNGVDAILSVSPAYSKPSQNGIFNHYKLISKASPLPIILYNVPSRTSSNISASTILRLASALPMIYMGAEGVISVVGQVYPKIFSKMVNYGISKNIKMANELHYKLYDIYFPLYQEGNPVGVKACLEILGICKSYVRPPLLQASSLLKSNLKKSFF